MAFGGRNFAIGLAILGFFWQGTYSIVRIVLICCMVSDAVNKIVMSLWGMERKALGNGVGCVVLDQRGGSCLVYKNERFQEVWSARIGDQRLVRRSIWCI